MGAVDASKSIGDNTIPTDSSGNLVANIVPRTGLATDLLALTNATGEIASATDEAAIIQLNANSIGGSTKYTPNTNVLKFVGSVGNNTFNIPHYEFETLLIDCGNTPAVVVNTTGIKGSPKIGQEILFTISGSLGTQQLCTLPFVPVTGGTITLEHVSGSYTHSAKLRYTLVGWVLVEHNYHALVAGRICVVNAGTGTPPSALAGQSSIAIGDGTSATGVSTIALGPTNTVDGDWSTCIGIGLTANASSEFIDPTAAIQYTLSGQTPTTTPFQATLTKDWGVPDTLAMASSNRGFFETLGSVTGGTGMYFAFDIDIKIIETVTPANFARLQREVIFYWNGTLGSTPTLISSRTIGTDLNIGMAGMSVAITGVAVTANLPILNIVLTGIIGRSLAAAARIKQVTV